MRFKRTFEFDAHHPQQHLSKYTRMAVVDTVSPEKGTCSIRWLDNPGGRQDVELLQGAWGEYHVPVKGAIVFCQCDLFDRVRIMRYANINQAQRILSKAEQGYGDLPKLKPGEKFWESVGGAYMYMTDKGRIIMSSALDDMLELDPDMHQVKSKSVNWQASTAGGVQTAGVVRRWVFGENSKIITDGIPTPVFTSGTPYTEHSVSVLAKQGDTTPILKMTIGTIVDSSGVVVDKNDNPATTPTKQLAARISLASGVQIDIDKEGRLSIKNVKMNINGGSVDATDPDVALGIETNTASLGTKGQHVARQHDTVTIPCGVGYSDSENAQLSIKSQHNIAFLQSLAGAIIAAGSPCTLNPALLSGNLELQGEITSGAPNIVVGDA
jgi:hypothetical protein